MILSETKLSGAYVVDIDPQKDNRGHFARIFCEEEFSTRGLEFSVVQASLSFNTKWGTLRGLHFQYPPAAETKYVRCIRGALVDVIVDLRPEISNLSRTSDDRVVGRKRTRALHPRTFRPRLYHASGRYRGVFHFIGNAYTPAAQAY